jgi:hypothetical protein
MPSLNVDVVVHISGLLKPRKGIGHYTGMATGYLAITLP